MSARKIVLLGMMTKIPVAGVVWQTVHYLLGLRRLGFEPYYVEAHARTPSMLMRSRDDDGAALAARFIDRTMRRFDLQRNWAYHALHADGRTYGLSDHRLDALYAEAELLINLHGGTAPRPEHSRTGRLVYLETDPVQLQVELQHEVPETIEFLEQHCAFFTFGENWGASDCMLAPTARFDFRPTRQPVCLDLWPRREQTSASFTTIGNWRQDWREVTLDGRAYSWSKHLEFEKFMTLPARSGRPFELALSQCDEPARERLSAHGWQVTNPSALSADPDCYRDYIAGSYGEFTVAKEQNVVLRSGWFSDRSATYLAAGRPVITQETGFSNTLPTGTGLHAFETLEDAAVAVQAVCADYRSARRGAQEVAREFFASDVVLTDLLGAVGIELSGAAKPTNVLTPSLNLTVEARRPLRLSAQTTEHLTRAPLPNGNRATAAEPHASVVVISHDNFHLTRLCVESVLGNTDRPPVELIVVDNGSRDRSRSYLRTIARRFPNVRLILNESNRGFPAACNQGLQAARGQLLVLLNNDTIVAPGWLERLGQHASREDVGLVGPMTNRIGNEAEVEVNYDTYETFIQAAAIRDRTNDGMRFEIPMPAMFCLAFRREVYHQLGPLDERFGPGTLEDDDYAERARRCGYRTVCAQDVLVHHFGEGSLGRMFASGAYSALIEGNRRRFEQKWGRPWQPYARRQSRDYELVCDAVRRLVQERIPPRSTVLVTSRGDERLLDFPHHRGWHFPQTPDGVYAGHYPADDRDAVDQLERLRAQGGQYLVLPKPSLWWLEHYREFAHHLEQCYQRVLCDEACVVFALGPAR